MAKYDFFISHHQSDTGTEASLLAEKLRNEGYHVYLDVDSSVAGDIEQKTLQALKDSRAFVVLVGDEFASKVDSRNDWVRRELKRALELGKKIVPVLVGEHLSVPENLPSELSFLPRTLHLRFDRTRVSALIEELARVVSLPPLRSRAAPSFGLMLLLVLLALSLGGILFSNIQLRSDLKHEQQETLRLKEEVNELRDEVKKFHANLRPHP